MENALFVGGNTAAGFVGYYPELMRHARRAVILKGGPGVGKSTLMRKAAALLRQRGHNVSCFVCSGDPDSLDAVWDADEALLLADGTAPHTLDPAVPGARESICNLGVCLDEKLLTAQAEDLEKLTRSISADYARATRYLQAAAQLRADADAVCQAAAAPDCMNVLTKDILTHVQDTPSGERWDLFAQAITCKGVVQRLDAVLTERTVCLELPFGMSAQPVFDALCSYGRLHQLALTVYHDPMDSGKTAHLRLGGTVITTAFLMDVPRYEPELDKTVLQQNGDRLSFDRAGYELLLHQAVDVLAQAKEKHDALEARYMAAMRYDRLGELQQALLDTL